MTLCAATAAQAAAGATLNPLFALGTEPRVALRRRVGELLDADGKDRTRCEVEKSRLLHRAADCRMHVPAAIGDYTDFFAGINHATNAGKLFRPDNPRATLVQSFTKGLFELRKSITIPDSEA